MIPGVPPAPPLVRQSRAYGPVVRPVLAALAASALLWHATRPERPEGADTRSTLADLLARDHGLVVEVGSVRPAGRAQLDAPEATPFAQGIYFAARRGDGGEPDILRADAHLASDGRVVALSEPKDLTRTPFASEQFLAGHGPYALYEVRVQGQLQSVLLVDDRGDERQVPADAGWVQRRMARLSNWQETGRMRGVGLRLYSFRSPPESVEAEFRADAARTSLKLVVRHTGEDGASPEVRPVRILPETGEVQVGRALLLHEARSWTQVHPIHWLVDFVRDMDAVGPRPIALLERWAFTAQDRLERLGLSLGLLAADDVGAELAAGGSLGVEAGGGDGGGRGDAPGDAGWPPPPVRPFLDPAEEGEGRWVPVTTPWLRTLPDAPPAIYKTALRTDPERPHSMVVLAAVDLRQLDLGMAGGTTEPHTGTGLRGTGRFTRTPAVVERLVAAFNGGFQTAHGAFGMMVDRQVILPPTPAAATLAVAPDGTVTMGTWNNSVDIPDDMVSFRQNLPPLLADGVWNPTHRKRWGGTVSDLDNVNTTRSAVAVAPPHTLLYAWGGSLAAEEIGRALLAAGAEYGMHLDMNPFHAGFWLLRTEMASLDAGERFTAFEGQPLSPKIEFDGDRFVNRNAKDFFYLTLRRLFAERLPAPPRGYAPWRPHRTAGPADEFLGRVAISEGDDKGDLLVALDRSSLAASMWAGTGEASALAGLAGLSGAPARAAAGPVALDRPVAALDLGTVDPAQPLGLSVGGRIYWPPRPDLPALTIEPEAGRPEAPAAPDAGGAGPEAEGRAAFGRLAVARAVTKDVRARPLRQVAPLLVEGRRVEPVQAPPAVPGLPPGETRWHALGIDPEGRVAYYLTRRAATAADLARPLEDLGVVDAIALPETAEDRSRLLLLERAAAEGDVVAEDPLLAERRPLSALPPEATRIYLTAAPPPPRVIRLLMPDVELSGREARRQRELRQEIDQMREHLRGKANEKYHQYIEKVRLKREEKTGVKEWDVAEEIDN